LTILGNVKCVIRTEPSGGITFNGRPQMMPWSVDRRE
jgi:hypothetical protein